MLELMFLIVLFFHNPNLVLDFMGLAFVVFLGFSIYTGYQVQKEKRDKRREI